MTTHLMIELKSAKWLSTFYTLDSWKIQMVANISHLLIPLRIVKLKIEEKKKSNKITVKSTKFMYSKVLFEWKTAHLNDIHIFLSVSTLLWELCVLCYIKLYCGSNKKIKSKTFSKHFIHPLDCILKRRMAYCSYLFTNNVLTRNTLLCLKPNGTG